MKLVFSKGKGNSVEQGSWKRIVSLNSVHETPGFMCTEGPSRHPKAVARIIRDSNFIPFLLGLILFCFIFWKMRTITLSSLRKIDLPGIQLNSSTLFISILLILHLFVGGTVGRGEWYFKYSDFKKLSLNWHVYRSSLSSRMKTTHLLTKEICWKMLRS